MKSMYLVCIIALLMSACAVRLKSDPVKVEGTVKHVVTLDAAELGEFYKAYCEAKPENDSGAKVDLCVADELALFWQAVNKSVPKDQSVSPTT